MAKVNFKGEGYPLNADETVLDCLLRHGVDFPHSCKTGVCQSCLSQTAQENIEADWQPGLKPTLASQGYFLPCIAQSNSDITVSLSNRDLIATEVKIIDIFYFNHNVICLRLSTDTPEIWTPGQYLNLTNPNGDARSYSIANQPYKEGYIELHIKCIPTGGMGSWLSAEAKIGSSVYIRGPIGDCFYCDAGSKKFPMVLAGTGTGLAPLMGITLDAIHQKHEGDIHLIHGGVREEDLYLDEALISLTEKHPNFTYHKCTLEESNTCQKASVDTILLATLNPLVAPRLYLCGPENITKKLKMQAFLAGVASNSIYSDAFVVGESRSLFE